MTRAAAVLLLLLAGCIHGPDETPRLGKMGKLFGGESGLDIVSSPDRVEAFRLRPTGEKKPYNQWPVAQGPVRVPSAIASRFSNGLTKPSTYGNFDEPKGCDPRPGYMLTFYQAGRSIDVAFCFECDILFTYRGEEPIWYANFDDAHNAILKQFIELFPADKDLPPLLRK